MFGSAEAMVAVLEIAFSYQPPRCPFLGLGSFGKKEAISPPVSENGIRFVSHFPCERVVGQSHLGGEDIPPNSKLPPTSLAC